MSNFIVLECKGSSANKRTVVKEKNIKRITDSTITPYEYTKLLSVRSKQLQLGFEPKVYVEPDKPYNPIEIAKREINERVVPLVVVRKIPDYKNTNGYREETWNIKELNIRDV